MSTINKMTIQGIRSYGPKDQDTQIIEFFAPVTLIVGQNGSGKTTIIECLKYATTSDMPPNTKGASFLFDPKLIDEVETKGRIKLYFKDLSGLSVQVQKNMCLSQKAKKLEFRTLETIISRYDKDNKLLSSITNKCINADAEVINAFGVSKAVLEHVIFCHQEDSNWPLSDGKTLKTRFDEIFAATKYIKALDMLRKVRLEKNGHIKQLEIERKHLEVYKNRSEQLKSDLDTNNAKLEQFDEKKENIKAKLAPVQAQLDYYLQEAAKIFEIKTELDKLDNEKQLLEKQIRELLESTKDCLFTGTDAELKQYALTYASKTDKMRKEEEEANLKKIDQLNVKMRQLGQIKSRLNVEIGAMESKHSDYLGKKSQLSEYVKQAAKLTCIDDFSDSRSINETLTQYMRTQQDELKGLEDEIKTRDGEYQQRIDAEREEKSKLDQNIQNKLELMRKYKSQLDGIEDELRQIQNSKLETELNAKIDQFEEQIAQEKTSLIDMNQLKSDISKHETEKNELKVKLARLDDSINKCHMNSKHKTELKLLENEKKNKQDQIRKIKIHIEEELEIFFGNDFQTTIADLKLKSMFEQENKQLISELAGAESKRKELEKRVYSVELKRKMINDELRMKDKQSREHEDSLLSISDLITCESDIDRYDSILDQLQVEYTTQSDEKGFLNGVDKTYKRFLQQLSSNCSSEKQKSNSAATSQHHSCPVCMRTFKDESELNDTISELKRYTAKLPQKIADVESKLKQTQTRLESMRNAKSTKDTYVKLKSTDLLNLRKEIEALDRNELPKLRGDLKATEDVVNKLNARKACADQLQNEIVLIDKYAHECAEAERKIEQAKRLNEPEDDVDLDELNMEKCAMQEELNRNEKRISEKREEMSTNYKRTDRINTLKERLNELKQRKTDLAARMQKKSQLDDKRIELTREMDEIREDMSSLNEKLDMKKNKLDELIESREEDQLSERAIIEQRRSALDKVKELFHRMRLLIDSINDYETNNQSDAERLKKELKNIETDERQQQQELDRIRKRLDEIKSELARQEIKQRELNDNLRLREKRAEYEFKQKQYLSKLEEYNLKDVNLDVKNFKQEQRKLEIKRDELLRELNEIKIGQNILEGRVQAANEELALENHKNAMQKYMDCMADLKVLEVCVMDIEKYYKALDRAIMNYHLLKMNEINKIIKSLWRQVYRGNDIDHIEIRSEEEQSEEAAAAAEIKARRSYNYRVVLVKGDTSLDMRGRCSAGQKVLASIIIRLALAETFCLNSGILALDEPTTNLDRENIESLAGALVEIIKSRSTQKNFQLIIITHDEDFVEMLGRSEYMDQFYRVHKDENGFSRISRRSNLSF